MLHILLARFFCFRLGIHVFFGAVFPQPKPIDVPDLSLIIVFIFRGFFFFRKIGGLSLLLHLVRFFSSVSFSSPSLFNVFFVSGGSYGGL